MTKRALLIACAACGCHARSEDTECPSCGAALRRADGSVERCAAAILLGLAAAATLSAAAACGSDSSNGGGATGAGGAGGLGGGSSTQNTTQQVAVSTYGTGPTTDAVTTGPGNCGDLVFGDAECESCAGNTCCAELIACDEGTPCHDLFLCEGACADQACVDQCGVDFQAGQTAHDELTSCLAQYCYGVCMYPACESGLSTGIAFCDQCLAAHCCDESAACTQNGADPQACLDCMQAGSGSLCDALLTCEAMYCSAACAQF